MPRRTVLTPAQRAALLALPEDRAELARHYTLSEAELAVIGRRRRARNRLGFALQLCALRYPGRLLRLGELVPAPVTAFVAEQVGVDPATLADYAVRENTRYEHSAALQDALGYRPFAGRPRREIEAWLEREAVLASSGSELAVGLRDELRRRRVIVPAVTTLERLCGTALARAERAILHTITHDLGRERVARLEALLAPRPDGTTWLAWLRRPAEGASPAAFVTTVERLGHPRSVGLEAERAMRVPRHHLVRLAREAERLPTADLRDLVPIHRRGVLAALVLELVPRLTDEALDLHDRLVGRMFRRAERRQLAALGDDRRPIGRTVRLFARVGAELLAAKAEGRDAFAAIDGSVGRERFAAAVEEAKRLAGRHGEEPVELVEASDARLRRHAPLLLETFAFRGVPAVRPLLAALELLRDLDRTDRRGLPGDAPTGFVPRRWRPFVTRGDGGLDRRFWELCAMAELRNGLRAGDVWVEGSRRYRSLDDDLVPLGRALEILPPGSGSEADDAAAFLEARRRRLEEALGEVERLAATAALPEAGIRNGRLTVAPLRAGTPKEAAALSDLLYEALPRVRITDLLEEVDRWTGFSGAFTHLKTGLPASERRALLAAVLADGTNMGLIPVRG